MSTFNLKQYLKKWGIIYFILLVSFVMERSLKKLQDEKKFLVQKLEILKTDIEYAKNFQIQLKEEVNSQSDPAWIELVLKKELGLIPEGQIKIVFND